MTDIASILAPIKEALAAEPDSSIYTHPRDSDKHKENSAFVETCNPERMSALIAAIEALQAERDALRDSLATEISRSCASERDCIWQPHCAGASKCLRPERPFDAALSAQTTKEA